MRKNIFIIFLIVGALSMIVMSRQYLEAGNPGILESKNIASKLWYLVIFRVHILSGIIAISFGPLQFLPRLRKNYLRIHKTIGYMYTTSVLLSAAAGIIIAQFAMGGMVTTIGFSILALLWASVTLRSVLAIRKRNVSVHVMYALFSYGLTFAAITQRTLLLLPLFTSVPFMPVYQLSAWLPWILNLILAYNIFKKYRRMTL